MFTVPAPSGAPRAGHAEQHFYNYTTLTGFRFDTANLHAPELGFKHSNVDQNYGFLIQPLQREQGFSFEQLSSVLPTSDHAVGRPSANYIGPDDQRFVLDQRR